MIGPWIQAVRVVCAAPRRDRLKVWRLWRIFERIDEMTRQFRRRSKLRCVAGCGRCCENPRIEATVLDVLPLAVYLWQKGEAQDRYEKARQISFSGECIFYQRDPASAGKGRCSVYPWRPSVCRLFGFSAGTDKNDQPQLVTCTTIKNGQTEEFAAALKAVAEGMPVPRMKDFSVKVFSVDPDLARAWLRINEAAAKAIERLGLERQLKS